MSTNTLNEDPSLSFWEIGGYKPNVRRIRNGATQLDDFSKMIKERMEIEQKYGKALQGWHAKWASHVDTSVSDSIFKRLWMELLNEGRELSQAHLNVKDRCNDELLKTLGLFRKENYHYTTMRGLRESREMDEEFEKAQRQWKKLREKVDATKKAYFAASRAEKSSYIQLMNSQGDASTTSETTDKTRERHEKCREETKKTRHAYDSTLREIVQYNPVYTENMTFVFEKCQRLELKRLRFAMEMLSGLEGVLFELINPLKLTQLHTSLQQKFKSITDTQLNDDLRDWSKFHGVEAPLNYPTFEEYTPEIRNIAGTATLKHSSDDSVSSVVLTRQIITKNELPEIRSVINNTSSLISKNELPEKRSHGKTSSLLNKNEFPDIRSFAAHTASLKNSNSNSPVSTTATPSVILHDDPVGDTFSDAHSARPAKALYNYTPIESDEIPLTKDELLEVISGPDELGWCYGRKGGMEGLFPASYVSVM